MLFRIKNSFKELSTEQKNERTKVRTKEYELKDINWELKNCFRFSPDESKGHHLEGQVKETKKFAVARRVE